MFVDKDMIASLQSQVADTVECTLECEKHEVELQNMVFDETEYLAARHVFGPGAHEAAADRLERSIRGLLRSGSATASPKYA